MDRRWLERRARQVMAISEINLQNRSKANNYDYANCQLEKRLATVALSTTNARNHGVAARDLTIRKRMDRNSRALHYYGVLWPFEMMMEMCMFL
jgi:hypothetical protein